MQGYTGPEGCAPRAQDLEVAALLLGRAEEERSRLEAELRPGGAGLYVCRA